MKKPLLCCLTLLSMQLNAEVLILSPSQDNTLYESQADPLSNGAGDYLFAGKTGQNADYTLRRAVLAFDVSAIPAGSLINNVTLEITVSRQLVGGTLGLYRTTSDWGEGTSDAPGQEGGGAIATLGDATWINAFHGDDNNAGIPWNNVGGDFAQNATTTAAYSGNGTLTITDPGLITDVQFWLDNPASNFGWFIRGNEQDDNSAVRFNSRENTTNPPRLIIDYSEVTSVQLEPAKDNTLYESVTGSLSNGAGDKLFFGLIQNGEIRRGLLEFDLTGIPPQAQAISASLDLVVANIPPTAQAADAHLHTALNEWGAAGSVAPGAGGTGGTPLTGDATWLHTFFDTSLWNTPGGDFNPTPSASAGFTTVNGETITFDSSDAGSEDLLVDLNLWIQSPADNHGWLLLGDEVNNGNARSVSSADAASNQPTLTIDYIIPDLIFADDFDD